MFASFRRLKPLLALLPVLCIGQSTPVATAVRVPTTHILAIGRFVRPLTANEQWSIMPGEVQDTLRLILDGKIEQGWVRKDQQGAVFVMNVSTVEEAHKLLEKFALGDCPFDGVRFAPDRSLGPAPNASR